VKEREIKNQNKIVLRIAYCVSREENRNRNSERNTQYAIRNTRREEWENNEMFVLIERGEK